VIEALAEMGAREITLIGGEAYLRKDLPLLVRRIKQHGMLCSIQTGGRNFSELRLTPVVTAGLDAIGVSIDGTRSVHDRLRGVPGSFDSAIELLTRARAAGLKTSVNTQVCTDSLSELQPLFQVLCERKVSHWQVQLTVAMGNAADDGHLLLQPYQILDLMPLLADLYLAGLDHDLLLVPGNNIGYFGPYEHLFRAYTDLKGHWSGCDAGATVLGIEADGTIKGCPSLATNVFSGGNVRDRRLQDIWVNSPQIRFREYSFAEPWGFCGDCYYSDVCGGGCTWTAQSLLGKAGNNPYCHYRALRLSDRGLRERIEMVEAAQKSSFATGRFRLILETSDGARVSATEVPRGIVSMSTKQQNRRLKEGRSATLQACPSCNEYMYSRETNCPHCGEDVEKAKVSKALEDERRRKVVEEVSTRLRKNRSQETQ
jgi:radical SAM protein with 4Fe4S-binding SPASM domain